MSPRLWTEIIRPALSDRNGGCIFIGTPFGRGNSFYDLWTRAQDADDWYALRLKASETGIIPESELKAMQKEMSKEEYAQELECSWSAAIKGAYYAEAMDDLDSKGRITTVAYDPGLPVHTGHDLGISDSWVIWYAQIVISVLVIAGLSGMRRSLATRFTSLITMSCKAVASLMWSNS
jgi:hypothetical protein